ncbi:hypothetical protein FGO68_gene8315 [Halteria grandinella]|uniref:Uncharacterized protein n=1 Tax=Halteria grandinella TaxID=5974 RepID=A0A8J8P270_HALGN|nr:hypothetical protein FGO68_gene8315 [Halteria grandinella]
MKQLKSTANLFSSYQNRLNYSSMQSSSQNSGLEKTFTSLPCSAIDKGKRQQRGFLPCLGIKQNFLSSSRSLISFIPKILCQRLWKMQLPLKYWHIQGQSPPYQRVPSNCPQQLDQHQSHIQGEITTLYPLLQLLALLTQAVKARV